MGLTWQTGLMDACNDISFHNAIWATSFMGSFGCGLYWWWDNAVHPTGFYSQFRPLSDFMAGIDFDNMGFSAHRYPDTIPEIRDEQSFPLEAVYLKSADETNIIGWVHNRSYYWYNYTNDWNTCRYNYDNGSNPKPRLIYKKVGQDSVLVINDVYPYPFYWLNEQTGDTLGWHFIPTEITDTSTTYVHNYFDTLHPLTTNFIIPLGSEDTYSYTAEFYDTRTGNLVTTQQVTDTLTDTLIVYVPATNDTYPDYAYKIYLSTGGAKSAFIANVEHDKPVEQTAETTMSFKDDIIIKPNPFKENFTINSLSGNVVDNLQLIDITGKLVLSAVSLPQNYTISVSQLPPGIYTLVCISGNNKFIKRLIKM